MTAHTYTSTDDPFGIRTAGNDHFSPQSSPRGIPYAQQMGPVGQYDTGQYDTGQYDTGQFDTGYQTGQYDTGQFDTGYQTGQIATGHHTGQIATGHHTGQIATGYQTGQIATGHHTGQFATGYETGYETGHYDTGQYDTGYDTGRYQAPASGSLPRQDGYGAAPARSAPGRSARPVRDDQATMSIPMRARRQPEPAPRPRESPRPSRPQGRSIGSVRKAVGRQVTRTPLLLRATLVTGLVAATAISVMRASGDPAAEASVALGASTSPVAAADTSPVQSCTARHQVTSRSGTRYTALVTIVNTGRTSVRGWNLEWNYPGAVPDVSEGWNATVSADAESAQALDLERNHVLPAGGSTTFAFTGAASGQVPVPSRFRLNGVTCK